MFILSFQSAPTIVSKLVEMESVKIMRANAKEDGEERIAVWLDVLLLVLVMVHAIHDTTIKV